MRQTATEFNKPLTSDKMEKIKRTLVSIGVFIAAQILVSVIFIIAAMTQGMDMPTAVNSTLGIVLVVSDLLVIVILLAIKYWQ